MSNLSHEFDCLNMIIYQRQNILRKTLVNVYKFSKIFLDISKLPLIGILTDLTELFPRKK